MSCGLLLLMVKNGTQYIFNSWRSWLRHCATNRRSQVRFPMVSLEFCIDIILPVMGSTQPVTEMSTRNIFLGEGGVNVAGA
jgi:hypothetical protein